MTAQYPTTCAELKAMISAEWPDVRESNLAVEMFYTDTLEFLPFEPKAPRRENVRVDALLHRYVSESGVMAEGLQRKITQLFFTEEDCVRAMWFQYNALTPSNDFNTDSKPLLFCWRENPEVCLRKGAYFGLMRYSALVRTRHGEIRSAWNDTNTKEVAA